MSSNSLLVKVIIIYFGINLILYAGGVRLGDASVFGSLVATSNSSATITDTTVQYGVGTINNNGPNVNQNTGSTLLSFIDVLAAVRAFINFVGVMFGGIFIVFLSFPPAFQFFVGVPLALLALVGSIYFARSGV